MSIDTLLEAARYLEWQAQQQQQSRREDEPCKQKETINTEAESKHVNLMTSALPVQSNHTAWADDAHRQQSHHPPAPPPPPLPPSQVPIAIIPMVPVVSATPSVPPLPLTAQIGAAATSLSSPLPLKTESTSSTPQQQLATHHLLCPSQIKIEPAQQLIDVKPGLSQPQVQIQYPASIGTNGSGSHHALVPHQAPPIPQSHPNGVTIEDMRGMEGKRRPGGAGTREVHNKLEKNRRAHLKECFETLKKNVPNVDEKKTSNLSVLRSALRYIQTLKRKEKEFEHEMERLAREKIATQQRLAELKKELSQGMDVMEIDRVLRQTIQPEDDQASTSTASEGEDNYDQDIDEEASARLAPTSLPKLTPPILQAQPLLASHLSIQHAILPLSGVLTTPPPSGPPPPQAIAPAPPPGPPPSLHPQHPLQPPPVQVQPTVIAHAAVSHPSVIHSVSHTLPANHKHLTHIAPSPGPTSSTPQPMAAAAPINATHQHIAQPIGHITVHPVAHLGAPLASHLPTLYPQGVPVTQPTMVGHITHTFTHHALPHIQASPQANTNGAQVNSTAVVSQGGQGLGKPTAMLAPHPQLVGQAAVLNPVTMVTVPTFPVSTLKLA
ncbi:MAX network transcriptional repressor b [Girardinichthys multiradiatus]|uniref:MAX network transcriptional repressor b n=1 Tax=Girardinichthys multiradiatus TaxID=208333 RepID=UPI001FAC6682|nr:MAX network transcriptional repressor b [Girardinichthys multiradiatus]